MKKNTLLLFSLFASFILTSSLFGQDISALNRFQFINIPPLEYSISSPQTGNITTQYDVYGVREIIIKNLHELGIETLSYNDQFDDKMRADCSIGHCEIYHISNLDSDIIDEIQIDFSDCNYEIVYSCQGKVNSMSAKRVTTAIAEGKAHIQKATNEALKELSHLEYQYDKNNPIEKVRVQTLEMDRKEVLAYFKSEANDFELIEGVYESIDVDAYFVELAVLKNGESYNIVVLESEDERWKPKEIRGAIEKQIDEVYYGYYLITKNYSPQLEITKTYNKYYDFKIIDSGTNEYYTIEFKKKLPK